MLKTGLQLRIGQSLSLTPQLQQTIKLLQYSSLELHNQVQQMIEQNPLLEFDEAAPAKVEEKPAKQESGETKDLAEVTRADSIPDDLPQDTDWESIYSSMPSSTPGSSSSSSSGSSVADMLENMGGGEAVLRDCLLEQMSLMPLGPQDQVIGETLIHGIGDDGYMADSIDELHQILQQDLGDELDRDEVEAVRHTLMMQLDPPGCCSLNLQESLQAQLRQRPIDHPGFKAAVMLVDQYFSELEKQNLKRLTSRTGLSVEEVEDALTVIRQLNPRPAAGVGSGQAEYVTPDIYVTQHKGMWVASSNPEVSPQLRIHPYYSSLVKRGDKSDQNTYIRDQLQEARWFLKSIQSRNETILKVAAVIVDKQQDFFNVGEEGMHPMVLRDVADVLGMHESTISRVTTSKYMLTPRGLFEFKYFFSSQLNTSDGGNASATAIRAIIKVLVAEENPQKPLSDSKITSILLSDKGIKVARRTVAKYREAMQIPPSNERKRIA